MNEWRIVALGELTTSVDYGVTASASLQPLGPKFLRITDIQNGSVNWNLVPWCKCDEERAAISFLREGDIVFARTGATTGKSFLITECPANTVFASYLIRVRLNSQANPRYVYHFFQTAEYWRQITNSARGVAQPGVNASTLKTLNIPLPSLVRQRRIASILDKAEELRAKRRSAMAKLCALPQAIFSEFFGDLTKNSHGWPKVELGQVADILTGYPFRSDQYVSGDQTVRLCRGANILPSRLDWSDSASWPENEIENFANYKLLVGDVVLAMDRPWISEGFKIAQIQSEDCPALLVQRVARLRGKNSVPNQFLFHLLNQLAFTYHCRPTETTVPHISPIDIRSFEFYLPPVPLQAEFARHMRAFESLLNKQRAALAKTDALFTSLQYRAFRGEL